jgi:hypothetical protein
MELRNHPLITHRGLPSWPPAWIRIHGEENGHRKGEIGILKDAMLTKIEPPMACYLIIEYEKTEYMGALLIDDDSFCRQIYDLLQRHIGYDIHYIGGLDLGHTL